MPGCRHAGMASITIRCTVKVTGNYAAITDEQMENIRNAVPAKLVSEILLDKVGRRLLTFTVTAPPADARAVINRIARLLPGIPILWGSPPASYFNFDFDAPPPPPPHPVRRCIRAVWRRLTCTHDDR